MTLLRSLLYNIWFYGVTVAMALASPAVWLLPRRFALRFARLWARLVLAGLGPLAGIRVVVHGREHLPAEGPALVASQHQSAFDTIIWLLLVPNVAYVLKQELLRIPVYGAICRRSGMIAVDRAAGGAAIRALLRGAERAVAERRTIVIFPEGTRAAPGAMLALQPGVAALATRTGLPVIPVLTDSGQCWGRRSFRRHAGVIHIAIRPPLPAGLGRESLMRELAEHYARGLGAAVDKSVGQGFRPFSDHASDAE